MRFNYCLISEIIGNMRRFSISGFNYAYEKTNRLLLYVIRLAGLQRRKPG